MKYLKACRACLSTEGKLEKIDEKSKKLFLSTTDIKIDPGDGFPQYFCAECYTFVKKTLAFRRRSRRALFVLKEILAVKKQVTQEDLLIVDRVKTNLISPLAFWKSEKNCTYYFSTSDVKEEDVTESDVKETSGNENVKKETSGNENELQIKKELNKTRGERTNLFDNSVLTLNAVDYKKDTLKTYLSKAIKVEITANSTTTANENSINETATENVTVTENQNSVQENFNVCNDLIKEDPTIIKSSVVLVNIRPSNWRELEKEEEEKRQKEIEQALKEIHGEDGYNDDDQFDNDGFGDAETKEEIDMDDVFKGLKEESPQDSDFEWPDTYDEEFTKYCQSKLDIENNKNELKNQLKPLNTDTRAEKKKKRKERVRLKEEQAAKQLEKLQSSIIRIAAKGLQESSIRYMSLPEQKEAHSARLHADSFRSQRLRCAMCVVSFQTQDEINEHVSYHNTKMLKMKHHCLVCLDVFPSQQHVDQHGALTHWYEYCCGACHQKHTTLYNRRRYRTRKEIRSKKTPNS